MMSNSTIALIAGVGLLAYVGLRSQQAAQNPANNQMRTNPYANGGAGNYGGLLQRIGNYTSGTQGGNQGGYGNSQAGNNYGSYGNSGGYGSQANYGYSNNYGSNYSTSYA